MILALWAGHTEQSRAAAGRVQTVLRRHGKEETAAAEMGISKAQLSKCIGGAEGLSMWRFATLPDPIKRDYHEGEVNALGGIVLWPEDLVVVHGFANMPRQLMVKMTAPPAREKEGA